MNRSVLMVAHDFPPASGSGPNRAAAFVRYLPDHGWQPAVLTVAEPWATNADPGLVRRLPYGARVVRTRSWERPAGPRPRAASPGTAGFLARGAAGPGGEDQDRPIGQPVAGPAGTRTVLRLAKSHLAHATRFPDAHVGWTPFALAAGWRMIRVQRPAVLYSTASPFTDHLVALLLHRWTGIPWVAELRDGWYRWNRAIFPDYPWWRAPLERALEAATVRRASRMVLVTEAMARAFRRQYPDLPPDHFAVVTNGFDPGLLEQLDRERPAAVRLEAMPNDEQNPVENRSLIGPGSATGGGRFVVLHTGALYHGRGIEAFLDAAGQLAKQDEGFREQFRLRLVGTLDEGARAEIARQGARHGLGQQVSYQGYLDHAATLVAQRAAHLLLLIVNTTPGAEATVPAKLFEYLAAGVPILAVVPPGATAMDIMNATRAGWVAPAHQPSAIKDALARAFHSHRVRQPFTPDLAQIARYDRRVLTADLARVLDAATTHRAAPSGA